MISHLVGEWPRYFALVEMGVLIACFVAIHLGSRAVLPRITYLAGWGILYVLVVVAAALVLNVTTDQPATTGLRVMSFVLTPAAVGGVIAVWLIARDNRGR